MSFSSISILGGINLQKKSLKLSVDVSFSMLSDLGSSFFTSNLMTLSTKTGTSSYLNGKYAIVMQNYNNNNLNVEQIPYNVLNNDLKYVMTGVDGSEINGNSYTTYNGTSVSTTRFNRYSSSSYSTSNGTYVGSTLFPRYTTYNSSLTIGGEFIQIYFPFKLKISNFYIKSFDNALATKEIYILGSNDDLTWHLILVCTNIPKNTLINKIIINSIVKYSMIRFVITKNYISNVTCIYYMYLDGNVEII
jgi:hypothetical protein